MSVYQHRCCYDLVGPMVAVRYNPGVVWRRLLALVAIAGALTAGCVPRRAASERDLVYPAPARPGAAGPERLVSDRCVRVVDGDTIHTQRHGPIRMIGINAQEYGEATYFEARDFVAERVKGKQVRLDVCPITPRDRYGRCRAVVYFREEGKWVNLNRRVVAQGWARIADYQPCHVQAATEWREDEANARRERKGIWAISAGNQRQGRGSGG